MTKKRKARFEKLEIFLIAFGSLLLVSSTYLYWTQFPLISLIFKLENSQSNEIVGKLKLTQGQVRRKLAKDSAFNKLPVNENLFNYDTVVTGPESEATLEFEDGSEIQLGPRTMVKLEYERFLNFQGINRRTRVQLVSGRVKGKSKVKSANLILQSSSKKLIVSNKENEKILEVTPISLKEAKERAEQEISKLKVTEEEDLTAKTSPSELAFETEKTQMPTKEIAEVESIEVEKTKKKKVRIKKPDLMITLNGIKPNSELKPTIERGKVKSLTDYQLIANYPKVDYEIELRQGEKIIDQQKIQSSGKRWSMKTPPLSPGSYSLVIEAKQKEFDKQKKIQLSFRVSKNILGIRLNDPLIAGQKTASNTYTGEIVEDFDISLSWDPIETIQSYQVFFFKTKSQPKASLIKKATSEKITFKPSKIFKGKLYYQVSGLTHKGFHVSSVRKAFRFDFLPPVLKFPKDQARLTLSEVKKDKGEVLFTWQKTNFTDYYELTVAKDPSFNKVIHSEKNPGNFSAVKIESQGSYWWRVRSFGQGVYSPYTKPNTFVIK